jgi:hypothetical protein
MRFRAEQAGWTIREAAWGLEERVLWRGGDATRGALERAGRTIAPLQKLIQTRLTWPLSDAYRARGAWTRGVLAASAVALAVAAGGAGAIISADHSSSTPAPVATPTVVPSKVSGTPALQGVTPQFKTGDAPAVPAPQPPGKASAPPEQVAWEFAQAFVGYEVGKPDKKVDQVFADTATKQLAKALATDPPRLPAKGKVPRARVLNVVLGTAAKNQVSASVSLVRLRAISELRLTLTKTGDQWRVAQVLG